MNVTITFDGGCRANGTDHAEMYGSALIDRHQKIAAPRLLTWEFGPGTNNQAEYLALIHVLESIDSISMYSVEIHTDSELVINHVMGHWKINNPELRKLAFRVRNLLAESQGYRFVKVPHEEIVRLLGH